MSHTKLDNYLRSYRKRSGLSQREIAFLLGTRLGAKVSRYEYGRRTPDLDTVLALETIYRAPASALFAGRHQRIAGSVRRRAARLELRLKAEDSRRSVRKREAVARIREHLPGQ